MAGPSYLLLGKCAAAPELADSIIPVLNRFEIFGIKEEQAFMKNLSEESLERIIS